MHRRHLHTAENGNINSSSDNHGSSGPVSLSSATTLDTGAPVVATARLDPMRKRRRRRGNSTNTSSSNSRQTTTAFSAFYDPNGDGVGIIIGLSMLVFFLIGVGLVMIVQLLQDHPNVNIVNANTNTDTNTTFWTFLFGGYVQEVVQRNRNAYRRDGSSASSGAGTAEKIPIPPSDIYEIPGSLSHIGDKSDHYATLRKEIDQIFPIDPQRSLQAVEHLKKYEFHAMPMQDNSNTVNNDNSNNNVNDNNPLPYDIYNCPDEPPEHYPFHWNTLELLKHWPPDDPEVRQHVYQGVCVFDYHEDYAKALVYRNKEVPFVVQGDPAVAATVERWNANGNTNTDTGTDTDMNTDTGTGNNNNKHYNYMERMLGNVNHRAEYSENNHFLYWKPGSNKPNWKPRQRGAPEPRHDGNGKPENWKEPTQMIRMTYPEWLSHANVTPDESSSDKPHWYFRLIGCGETGPHGECDSGSSEYLFDELTFFQPKNNLLYMVQPQEQKGIHCRFGMLGVIAENHFDSSRNAIVVLGGERRYILSPPDQCRNLALLPKSHPSARHSAVDWSQPDLEQYPQFAEAKSNEVVLQAGDVLYLPTNWFHYIISLSLNFQCNTRSGRSMDYMQPIQECGF
jgi:hypothetical protein